MDRDRSQQVSQLYYAVMGRPPAERAAFLHDACRNDDWLRKEVESLLVFDDSDEQFLDSAAGSATNVNDEPIPRVALAAIESTGSSERGGMGVVYRADHRKLQRNVAIEIVSGVSDPSGRRQLLREARRRRHSTIHTFAPSTRSTTLMASRSS